MFRVFLLVKNIEASGEEESINSLLNRQPTPICLEIKLVVAVAFREDDYDWCLCVAYSSYQPNISSGSSIGFGLRSQKT